MQICHVDRQDDGRRSGIRCLRRRADRADRSSSRPAP